jgi:hypothetical protein
VEDKITTEVCTNYDYDERQHSVTSQTGKKYLEERAVFIFSAEQVLP